MNDWVSPAFFSLYFLCGRSFGRWLLSRSIFFVGTWRPMRQYLLLFSADGALCAKFFPCALLLFDFLCLLFDLPIPLLPPFLPHRTFYDSMAPFPFRGWPPRICFGFFLRCNVPHLLSPQLPPIETQRVARECYTFHFFPHSGRRLPLAVCWRKIGGFHLRGVAFARFLWDKNQFPAFFCWHPHGK